MNSLQLYAVRALVAGLTLCLVACGDSTEDPGADPDRGFTDCGDFPSGPVRCQPGQYCADATFSECVPGCTSDVNCAAGQTCDKPAGESVGDCRNTAPPPMMGSDAGAPITPDLVPLCREACQVASFQCEDSSISAPMVAACDTWCRDAATSDGEREAFAACVDAAFFTDPVCDEADCLP